jgi:hypothetical protein
MKIIKKLPAFTPIAHTPPPDPIEIVVLLDASGSMQPYRAEVVSTFNEYVNKLRGLDAPMSLYTFDSNGIIEHFCQKHTSVVQPITQEDYHPFAGTPLYDALGTILSRHSGNRVQFIVHTDGEENESKEWSLPTLNAVISTRAAMGCQFTWLGEGPSGWNQTKQFSAGQNIMYTNATRGQAMGAVYSSTQSYSAGAKAVGGQVDLTTPVAPTESS